MVLYSITPRTAGIAHAAGIKYRVAVVDVLHRPFGGPGVAHAVVVVIGFSITAASQTVVDTIGTGCGIEVKAAPKTVAFVKAKGFCFCQLSLSAPKATAGWFFLL